MQQYKRYTLTPRLNSSVAELKQAQQYLLKYSSSYLPEIKALSASSSELGPKEATVASRANEVLCAHMPSDSVFALGAAMKLEFITSPKSRPYSLDEGMTVDNLSAINYHPGSSKDELNVSAAVELELNRFSDDNHISEKSYMFFEATVKNIALPAQNLGAKLKELFGHNNYYAHENAGDIIIQSDAEGAKSIMVKEHKVLSQLGLADRFAPTMLQQKLLDNYVSQDDAEKTIIVKLADKEILITLKKDSAGILQAYVPEVVAIDSLQVVVPASDNNGAELSLKQMPQGGMFTRRTTKPVMTMLTELDVYAMRCDKFKAGFDLATFQYYAKQQQKCELLPAWADLIASNRDKYQEVLSYYIDKFDQVLLENPLYLVSFMQHYKIPVAYNGNSLALMFSALEKKAQDKPILYRESAKEARKLSPADKLQQLLLKEHSSAAIVYARNLSRLNATARKAQEQRLAGKSSAQFSAIKYNSKVEIALKSPATIINRAAKIFIEHNRQAPTAIKLQAFARSKLVRGSYLKTVKSVVIAQAAIRRLLRTRKAAEMKKNILKIQSFMRMNLAMNSYAQPKKIIPKVAATQKLITKNMQMHIATNPSDAISIVNEYFLSQYELYSNASLSAIKDGDPEIIAAAFMAFSKNIVSIHTELDALLSSTAVTKLRLGQAQILTKVGRINAIVHELCATKNDLYAEYMVSVVKDKDAANDYLLGGLEEMYQKYSRDTQQVKHDLAADSLSSLDFIFGVEQQDTKADTTTIDAILHAIGLTSDLDDYLNDLPKSTEELAIYATNVIKLVADFKADVATAKENYKADLSHGLPKQEAMAKFNRSIKDQRSSLQDELDLAIPHVQNILKLVMRSHNELRLRPAAASDDNIMRMAAEIIQRKTRTYFKTSKHKKRMAHLHNADFKAARLDAAIKVEAAVRMFLEHNRYTKLKAVIIKLQLQVKSVQALHKHAKTPPIERRNSSKLSMRAMIGISSSSASSSKSSFNSDILAGLRFKMQGLIHKVGASKADSSQEESKRHGLAVLAAHAVMQPDPDHIEPVIQASSSVMAPSYEEKPLTPAKKDFLDKANVSHLRLIAKDLTTKVQSDIALLEAAVVASPKDLKAIAKLRYLYVRNGDKALLADSVVIAKAKLALVGSALLDQTSKSDAIQAGVVELAIVRKFAAVIATMPISQMSVDKTTGGIYFAGGYVWPKLLNRLANKGKGLLQSAITPLEREIWFASICGILEQPASLTPTINVGATTSKREEVVFIDNAITQLVVSMSKGLIKDQSLLLRGLKTVLFQINHGGYKRRVLKSNLNQERKNMLGVLKSFNLSLDEFEHEVLAKNLKTPGSKHDEEFVAKKDSLEQIFVDLLKLFKVFDKDANSYKNQAISSEWLAIVGKLHFLAHDHSFVARNNIGFSTKFLDHHKACICQQEGGVHPVRAILAKASVSYIFNLATEQVKLTAQEMLELGEVTLDENKSSCNIELSTKKSNRASVVIRPHNTGLMHVLLFICTATTVVMLGLLPTLLASSFAYAMPAIVALSFASYKLASRIDKEVVVGSFDVANPNLIEHRIAVPAAAISSEILGAFVKSKTNDQCEEEIEVSLVPTGK